jgi:hypothetical protein
MQSLLDGDRLPQARIPVHTAHPAGRDRMPHSLRHTGHLPGRHQPGRRRVQPHTAAPHPRIRGALRHRHVGGRPVDNKRTTRPVHEPQIRQCPVIPSRLQPSPGPRRTSYFKNPARPQIPLDHAVQRRQRGHTLRTPPLQRPLFLGPKHPALQLRDIPARLREDLPQGVAQRKPVLPRPRLDMAPASIGQPPPHRPLRHTRQLRRDPHVQPRQRPLPIHRKKPPYHHTPRQRHTPGRHNSSRPRGALGHTRRTPLNRHTGQPTRPRQPLTYEQRKP